MNEEIIQVSPSDISRKLFSAISVSDTAIAKNLIASSQCTNEVLMRKKDGDTVLTLAAHLGRRDVVKALLASPHCSIELLMQQDRFGETALMKAIWQNDVDTVKDILTSPFCTTDVLSMRNLSGDSAFTVATRKRNPELVQAILNAASCNEAILKNQISDQSLTICPRKKGDTALIEATRNGDDEIVSIILNSQHCSEAVVDLMNSQGHTAYDIAHADENEEIITLFNMFASYQSIRKNLEVSAVSILNNESSMFML